jgi:hypothetical protein
MPAGLLKALKWLMAETEAYKRDLDQRCFPLSVEPRILMRQTLAAFFTVLCLMGNQLVLADPNPSSPAVRATPNSILDQNQAGYRLKVGAVPIIALSDGTLAFPADELLLNAKPGEIHRLLNEAFDPAPLASVNTYLVFLPGKLLLIDTGAERALGTYLR